MMRNLTLSAAVAALFALPLAGHAADTPVGTIDVEAPLSVLGNRDAGALWANLETDLANAIAARITAQVTTTGAADAAKITVRVEEFRLPAAMGMSPDDEGVLAGQVIVTGQSVGQGVALRVTMARPAMPLMPADPVAAQMELNAVQYTSLLNAFADQVAEAVQD